MNLEEYKTKYYERKKKKLDKIRKEYNLEPLHSSLRSDRIMNDLHKNKMSEFDKSLYKSLEFYMRYKRPEVVSEVPEGSEVPEEGGNAEDVTAEIGKKEEFEFITNEFFSDGDKSETKIFSTDKKNQLIVVHDGNIYQFDDPSKEIDIPGVKEKAFEYLDKENEKIVAEKKEEFNDEIEKLRTFYEDRISRLKDYGSSSASTIKNIEGTIHRLEKTNVSEFLEERSALLSKIKDVRLDVLKKTFGVKADKSNLGGILDSKGTLNITDSYNNLYEYITTTPDFYDSKKKEQKIFVEKMKDAIDEDKLLSSIIRLERDFKEQSKPVKSKLQNYPPFRIVEILRKNSPKIKNPKVLETKYVKLSNYNDFAKKYNPKKEVEKIEEVKGKKTVPIDEGTIPKRRTSPRNKNNSNLSPKKPWEKTKD